MSKKLVFKIAGEEKSKFTNVVSYIDGEGDVVVEVNGVPVIAITCRERQLFRYYLTYSEREKTGLCFKEGELEVMPD